MEVVSGVASAFAVVSLSVQLLDKVHSFCEFWEKVRGAPNDIVELVRELRLLEAVVKEIQQKEKQYGTDATLDSILRNVSAQIDALLATMAKYRIGLASDGRVLRTWSSFKISLRSNQLMQFRLSLSETKATLLLARFNLNEKVQYRIHEQTMTALSEGFTKLNVQKACGTVSTQLVEPRDVQDHFASLKSEIRRVTANVPQPWIQSGMQAVVEKAIEGMAKKLEDENLVQENGRHDEKQPIRLDNDQNPQGYSSPDADVESAKSSVRSGSNPRYRRARYLGPNYLHGSYASITHSMFGTIYLNTVKFFVEDAALAEEGKRSRIDTEIETDFTFYPASWLMWWGLRYGLRVNLVREGTAWKNSLQSFHAVPDKALIFEFCEQGNIMAVNSLLAHGQASPWDTNSRGWTPLHVASWHCNIPLIKALIQAGSSRQALTFDFPNGNYEQCSPLVAAATISSTIQVPPEQRIEALRLLLENLEFTDHESQAWKMVFVILERERASTGLCDTTEVSEWVLDTFLTDLREVQSPPIIAWLLTFCIESPNLLRRVLKFVGNFINESIVEGDYTPLHGKIAENFPDTVIPGIRLLLEHGADPHRVGLTTSSYGADGTPRLDTPTSLSMRRSSSFFKWRQLIRDTGFDIKAFIVDELAHTPLITAGWTIDSLTRLFELEFEPLELAPDLCTQCGRVVYHLFDHDEVWWDNLLDGLKNEPKARVGDHEIPLNFLSTLFSEDDQTDDCESPTSPVTTTSSDSSDDVDLCWKCGIMQRIYGSNYSRGKL